MNLFLEFVNAINAHDMEALSQLMSEDHIFTDAQGKEVSGNDNLKSAWGTYFEWFPDYNIDVTDIFEQGEDYFGFGTASGSWKGQADSRWQIPASWKAIVANGKIKSWQIIADTKIPYESMKTFEPNQLEANKPGVTGIGGVFFKCNDPAQTREWYQTHLGIESTKYGATFEWLGTDGVEQGTTAWNPFPNATTYFSPSQKDHMINYRVRGLSQLLENFEKAGVTICDKPETYDYGTFVHILDLDGNKIELWEPV